MNLWVWLGNVCLTFVICVTKICRRVSGVSKEHLHCHCWSFLGLEMAAGFRSNIFDPVLIIAQIVATQCFFYLSLGLWLAVADLTGGIQTSVDQIFDYHEFEGSYDGWLVMGAMIINSFTGALALWWVVRRGKQCLDFTVTVFLFHLVVCVCYGGLPRSWAWWITNLVSLAIMTILGEYLCMRSELAAIPLSSSTMGKS